MNNIPLIIDIIIAAVILIGIISGTARGFIKTVFGLFRGIIACIISYFLTPVAANFIKETAFYSAFVDKTKNGIYETVRNFLESDPDKLLNQSAEINALFERFGSSVDFIKNEYERLVSEKISDAALYLTEHIVSPACSVLLAVLTFLVLFAFSLLLLYFVMKIFDGISKLPVLNGFNKLLGAISGGILGCFVVFIIITVFEAILPFAAGAQNTLTIKSIAESSYLYALFTAINPLGLLFALIA
ncbi:MAG: CvpA family protein [Ruminococcaceae bacterium]|nr:CvpA family protein [Oscillospiraceae bacterium]